MNIYAVIVLVALVGRFLLHLLADILNLKALPANADKLEGIYDASTMAKSQQYIRVQTRFELVTAAFHLFVTLAFWFCGGFDALDQVVRGWAFGPIASGLIYIGVLAVAMTVLAIPQRIYSTFVIEQRFGFNKTTAKLFVMDQVKALIVGSVIGGLLLTAILAIFEYTAAYAWIYCWVGTTLFVLFMQVIAPTWILPLFNKFTPLKEGELREAIESYAKVARFPLMNLFVMDGSKRSTKSNAFFIGFGRFKRIALFDTLIENHSVGEIVAVLAHEIGHFKLKHIWQGMVLGILEMGLIWYLMSVVVKHAGLFDAFGVEQASIYVGLVLFGLLYSPIGLALSVVMHFWSRRNEYEADRFAADSIAEPDDLVIALKKLTVHNLSNLTPHPFYVFLHYSHPPVLARIGAIRARK